MDPAMDSAVTQPDSATPRYAALRPPWSVPIKTTSLQVLQSEAAMVGPNGSVAYSPRAIAVVMWLAVVT